MSDAKDLLARATPEDLEAVADELDAAANLPVTMRHASDTRPIAFAIAGALARAVAKAEREGVFNSPELLTTLADLMADPTSPVDYGDPQDFTYEESMVNPVDLTEDTDA